MSDALTPAPATGGPVVLTGTYVEAQTPDDPVSLAGKKIEKKAG